MKPKTCTICGMKFKPTASGQVRCEDHRADVRAYIPSPDQIAEECRKIREERVERGEGFRPYVPRVFRLQIER